MMEILSLYWMLWGDSKRHKHGGQIPAAVRKGFGEALNRFDAYQLGKYKAKTREIGLYDLVRIIHPPHNKLFKQLLEGTLPIPETWETRLSEAGSDAKLKEKAWSDLVLERKIGYFALLRNLRNIVQQAPSILDEALEMLREEKLIKKSLVLPFRFMTAYDVFTPDPYYARECVELDATLSRKVIRTLDDAVSISLNNVPHLPGSTLVAIDVSGSMCGRPADIASLFGAVLVKTNDCDCIRFAGDAHYANVNTKDSVATIRGQLRGSGGSTDFRKIFQTANKPYDRIIILSDMQAWVGYETPREQFRDYKRSSRMRYGINPTVYCFDLQGYGTLQFPEKNVYQLAGFSDKIFDVMAMLEEDQNALIHVVENVEL
jgi:hypothetical protein